MKQKNVKSQKVEQTYYEILQVEQTASQEDIKSAYHALAKVYHPDVNSDESSSEQFSKLEQAYSVLSDEQKRAEYDLTLSPSSSALVQYDANATALSTDVAAAPAKKKDKFFTAGNMAVMAILTAIAYVLYLLPKIIPIFNLPFFPPWLDIQISDLPALLGGFAIGPWASVIIIVLKCALKMPLTSTSCVGELADIVVGIAFVLPASLIYRKFKSRKSSVLGMLLGTGSAIVFAVLANWIVLIPFYAMQFGNMDYDKGMMIIVGAVSTLYEKVTVDNFYGYYLTLGVIPFNLLRCAICGVITFFVYKPLSKALHWEIKRKKKVAVDEPQQAENVATDAQADSNSSEATSSATTSEQDESAQQ